MSVTYQNLSIAEPEVISQPRDAQKKRLIAFVFLTTLSVGFVTLFFLDLDLSSSESFEEEGSSTSGVQNQDDYFSYSYGHIEGGVDASDVFYRYELGDDFVCADGTPYVFYVRRPNETSPNFNKWILRVEGGRWCEDQESCDAQYEEFDGYYLTAMNETCIYRDPLGGVSSVIEHQNERFYDWNMVFLHNCNADDQLGQARAGEDGNPTTYHFTGSINVWGTFDWLASGFITDPESILVIGLDTAGTMIANQVNDLEPYWSEAFPDADLHFVIDAAWNHEEYLCYNEDQCEEYMGDVALRLENQNPRLNPECLDEYAEKCFYAAEYNAQFIHSNYC